MQCQAHCYVKGSYAHYNLWITSFILFLFFYLFLIFFFYFYFFLFLLFIIYKFLMQFYDKLFKAQLMTWGCQWLVSSSQVCCCASKENKNYTISKQWAKHKLVQLGQLHHMSAQLLINLEIFHFQKIINILEYCKEFFHLPSSQQNFLLRNLFFQRKENSAFLKPPRLFMISWFIWIWAKM
jgi:hypothetical protein